MNQQESVDKVICDCIKMGVRLSSIIEAVISTGYDRKYAGQYVHRFLERMYGKRVGSLFGTTLTYGTTTFKR